mgnify:CR=1 FL=1
MAEITIKTERAFNDLDLNFNVHPTTKDVTQFKNERSIVNSIKNLVLTNHYERPFQPELGSNLRRMLFEQVDNLTGAQLEREITEADIGSTVLSLQTSRIPNPLAMNMYCLGFDSNKNLTTLSQTTKNNLKTYLSQFRMVTDAVNIKDAYIINLGIDFGILTKVGFNKQDVLLRCVNVIKDFFEIDRWQIGQPVTLSDIAYELSLVDGVATVVPPAENNPNNLPIVVTNKYSVADGYSGNFYDITSALKEGVLYPSLDPSIFELKYPNSDIEGKVLGDNLGVGV